MNTGQKLEALVENHRSNEGEGVNHQDVEFAQLLVVPLLHGEEEAQPGPRRLV